MIRTKPVSRIAVRVAVVLLATLFTLFLVDFAYTMVVLGAWNSNYWLDHGHISRKYSVPDPELGFVRKPGVTWYGRQADGTPVVYKTDENGFRNPPGLKEADVAFIGDSYTEAGQIVDRFTFVQRVAANTGLSAVNLGRGAYGSQQEEIVLKRYGMRYHPRFVVWQFFEGNDLSDAAEFAYWKSHPDKPVPLYRRYLANSVLKRTVKRIRGERPFFGRPATLLFTDGTKANISLVYASYGRPDPGDLSRLEQTLADGYRLCQARHIRVAVICLPTMLHTLRPYIHVQSAAASAGGAENGGDDLETELKRFCENLGCAYIDTLGPLRRAAANNDRRLYIPNDEHLDVRGHALVAHLITNWIQSARAKETE